jgi:glycosyltransferase involved in cell wall biosynthesis
MEVSSFDYNPKHTKKFIIDPLYERFLKNEIKPKPIPKLVVPKLVVPKLVVPKPLKPRPVVKDIEKPLVSIIVPMYNVSKYIKDCVNSLLAQTYPNIEIILVDDCSTDDTLEVAKSYNITILQNKENVGTYISINRGIEYSIGSFITIIGSDDTFTPDKIEKQAMTLIENKKIVACFCKYRRYHYKTRKILTEAIGESTIMFRREIIDHIGFYDSVRFAADTEFMYRIYSYYGKKATRNIKKVMYLALLRPNSLTSSGVSHSKSDIRAEYRRNYSFWHRKKNLYMPFPLKKRPFPASLYQLF